LQKKIFRIPEIDPKNAKKCRKVIAISKKSSTFAGDFDNYLGTKTKNRSF
jgi:hypothetical protein